MKIPQARALSAGAARPMEVPVHCHALGSASGAASFLRKIWRHCIDDERLDSDNGLRHGKDAFSLISRTLPPAYPFALRLRN